MATQDLSLGLFYKELNKRTLFFERILLPKIHKLSKQQSVITQPLWLTVDPPSIRKVQVGYENRTAPGATFSLISTSPTALEGKKPRKSR